MKCTDCGKSMVEGFVPDATYGAVVQARWHPGEPEESRFFGITNGIKSTAAALIPITAYRCESCGLLKLFAVPPAT